MSLLELPTELLDNIFSYLDWDRSRSLYPERDDLVNISLTCRRLRKALSPLIFRDVVLRLRWQEWRDGGLVEPCLFKLRKRCPELAKHIRCVFIRTEYAHCAHCDSQGHPELFAAPSGIPDWLSPSGEDQDWRSSDVEYRSRVDQVARKYGKVVSYPPADQPELQGSAEEIICASKQRGGTNIELDALSIVMLCLPARTNTIVFRSLTFSMSHESKSNFAFKVLAVAMEVLQHRLKDLSVVSNNSAGRLGMSRAALGRLGTGTGEGDAIAADVIDNLGTRRLLIALNDEDSSHSSSSSLTYASYQRWHRLSHSIRDVEMRHVRSDIQELLKFVKGFDCLQSIAIRDCVLLLSSAPRAVDVRNELEQKIWLTCAIEIRRAMQHVKIAFSNLYLPRITDPMPESSVLWIVTQAVPPGVLIDADREDRLLVDFASFTELWSVEDGARGSAAKEQWQSMRGPLSDAAMTRRWR